MENKEKNNNEYTQETYDVFKEKYGNEKEIYNKFYNFIFHSDDASLKVDALVDFISLRVIDHAYITKQEFLKKFIIELAKDEKNYKSFVCDITYLFVWDYPCFSEALNIKDEINFENRNTRFIELVYNDLTNIKFALDIFKKDRKKAFNTVTLHLIGKSFRVSSILYQFVYELIEYKKAQRILSEYIIMLYYENINNILKDIYYKDQLYYWIRDIKNSDSEVGESQKTLDKFDSHMEELLSKIDVPD